MPKQKKAKKDSEILFPEVSFDFSIGKVTSKPFTYGDVIDLAPNFEDIINEFTTRGLSLDTDTLDITQLLSIYIFIGKPALPILCRVTGLEEDSIRSLSIVESTQLLITVIQQNVEVFLRFFDQFLKEAGLRTNPTTQSLKSESVEEQEEKLTETTD